MWMVISIAGIVLFILSIIGAFVCFHNKNHSWKRLLAVSCLFLAVFLIAIYNYEPSYKQSEAALVEGKALLSQSKFEEAIQAFIKVDPRAPQYSEAISLINETKDIIAQGLISAGKVHLSKKNYQNAIDLFRKVDETSSYYSEAQNLVIEAKNYEAESFIAEGKLQSSKGNYLDAIDSFKKVDSSLLQYSESRDSLIKEASTKYAKKLFAESKTLALKNDFDGATERLDTALTYDSALPGAKAYYSEIENKRKEYILALEQKEINEYKNSCRTIEYRVLNKNPDSLAGTKVKLRGEIMQITEYAESTFMLLQVTYTSYGYGYGSWNDNVAIFFNNTIDAYEDDVITVWGEVKGAYSYESVAHFNITVPSVNARYIQYPKH